MNKRNELVKELIKEFDFESVDQTIKVCQSGLEVIQPILEEKFFSS